MGGIGGFFSSDAKRFEARERNGAIERRFFVDGTQVGVEEGRKWLATFLPDVLRNMAVNADRDVVGDVDELIAGIDDDIAALDVYQTSV